MTLSGMTVLSMDEILLRTEISRMRKEGTRRGASERNRRGYGRDKRGPPATGTAAQARRTKVFRRPRRWASERGSVPRPSPCRPTASRDVLHRRARIPAPRHETSRHRKMRFHRVIILEAVAPHGVIRSAAMNCGLPRSVSVACARREADTFPVLAHACQDLIPVRSAGGGRHGPPPRKNRDKSSKENRVRPPHRKRKGHPECGVPFSTSWGG